MYPADVKWAAVNNGQLDWVDHVLDLESWLEQYVGTRGVTWDWLASTGCGIIGFTRDQDRMWYLLNWAG